MTRRLQVAGTGCSRCVLLEARVRQAVDLHQGQVEVESVSGIMEIIALGLQAAPALLLDGRVLAAGRVPSVEEILEWLDPAPDPPDDAIDASQPDPSP
ncbi:MAG: thioredoxin family protein [Acidobacteriota bacterium]|nr:thioredoxin family protein [Acidobacteriota bacterium]MDQ7088862.1 thioredoxin family protein [Acidobacteriota bacterium]